MKMADVSFLLHFACPTGSNGSRIGFACGHAVDPARECAILASPPPTLWIDHRLDQHFPPPPPPGSATPLEN